MSVIYATGFDITDIPYTTTEFQLTLSSSGETTFYVTYSTTGTHYYPLSDQDANGSSLYGHIDIEAAYLRPYSTDRPYSGVYADDGLDDILEDALNAGNTAESWGGAFTVSFSATTGKYTISHSTLDFTMVFTVNSSRILGFSETQSGSDSYTSDRIPYFCIAPQLGHLSTVSDEYDMFAGNSLAISDGGYSVGMSRTVPLSGFDWVQQFEPKERVFTRHSSAEEYWKYQMLWDYCGTVYPIVVCNDEIRTGYYPVCVLTEKGSQFRPRRDHPDYDGHWHIPFNTYLAGWIYVG